MRSASRWWHGILAGKVGASQVDGTYEDMLFYMRALIDFKLRTSIVVGRAEDRQHTARSRKRFLARRLFGTG